MSPTTRWVRPMSWLALVVAVYVGLCVALYFGQDRILYHPETGASPDPAGLSLVPWPSPGAPLGWISTSPPSDPRGTCLVWHGNAGTALDRVYFSRALEARGYRVVLMEYPGYGGRAGGPGEAAFVEDAMRALEITVEEFGRPIHVIGESLGGAVAAAVAGRAPDRVDGVVLITPWFDLPSLAQAKYPLFPTRWLLRDIYDSAHNLESFPGPVAVARAARDEIIPEPHTVRLFDSIGSTKRMWVFEGAGHNSWPVSAHAPWWDEVVEFLSTETDGPDHGG